MMNLSITHCHACGHDITDQLAAARRSHAREIALNRHLSMTAEERSEERRRAAKKVSKTKLSRALKAAWKRRKARLSPEERRLRMAPALAARLAKKK